jgi:enterochelin esterase family protein
LRAVVAVRAPAIDELERRVRDGDRSAVDVFWADAAKRTTPFIDRIAGDGDRVLLTFVFRGDAQTQAVAGIGWVMGGAGLQRFTRVAGTDVWYRSTIAPCGLRTAYRFLADPPADDVSDVSSDEWAALQKEERIAPDPLNPLSFQSGPLAPLESVVELPGADAQPWIEAREGVPCGTLAPHRFESEALGGARIVWTYEPPEYDAKGDPYPVLILHDGYAYAGIERTLDNLIAARKIPPLVCVLYQWADRNAELLGSEVVADVITGDLLRTWLPARLHVTDTPERVVIGGASAGGVAALLAALRHPDRVRNVIAQSGAFWWGPNAQIPADMHQPGVEWEWLTAQVAREPRPPLRASLEVGVLETSPAGGRMPDMIGPNRRMRDALLAAGHEVHYREFNGGHDFVCWRGNIADALIAIAGPWATP